VTTVCVVQIFRFLCVCVTKNLTDFVVVLCSKQLEKYDGVNVKALQRRVLELTELADRRKINVSKRTH
jgi:hypothetical protein